MDSLIKRIQEEHKEWQLHNFGKYSTAESLIGIAEELGELSHAYLKKRQKIRSTENHEEKMKDAIGDLMIYLIGFCNSKEYDLDEILSSVWETVKTRDWVKFPNDGKTQ